jgi:hypothetical protein
MGVGEGRIKKLASEKTVADIPSIIKELKSETVVVGSRQWSVERAEGVMYEIAERRHCGDR